MVGRSADKRQANGPVHSVLEPNHFERPESLVVIHRHHGIVFAAISVIEQGVRRQRPDDLQPTRPRGANRGSDEGLLLGTELTAFTRVRIQTADRHPRARQSQVATCVRGEFNRLFDPGLRQAVRHLFERQVSGDQRHAQPAAALVLAEQHHRGAIGAGELREKFGLADE